MKKILLPLVAILVSMVACQKENDGVFTLEVEEYTSDAKLHLDNNYAVWDNGDKIWINSAEATVTVGNGTATISGVTSATTYTAIYPYAHAGMGTGYKTGYSATQDYRESNGKQIVDAPMVAQSDGNNLKFYNLGSILAVHVSGVDQVRSIKVTANSEIFKDYLIDFNGTHPTLGFEVLGSPSSNTFTLNCNGVEVPADGKTFYIAIPSISAQLSITVDDGACRYTRSRSASMAYEANHGYNVTFDASEVTPVQYAPLRNQIWYTTNNSNDIDGFNNSGVGTLQSNEWNESLGYYVTTYSSNVASLPSFFMKDNSNLTEIILPEGLTSIGYAAFNNCGSLNNVVLPNSLTSLEDNVFWHCTNLQTIEFPNPNVKFSKDFFYNSGIQTIILHTNSPFSENDISFWTHSLQEVMSSIPMTYQSIDEAMVHMYNDYFWSINTVSSSIVTIYVPDVQTCQNISYNIGYIDFMAGDYIYKPWQYLIDINKVQLLPLSSL